MACHRDASLFEISYDTRRTSSQSLTSEWTRALGTLAQVIKVKYAVLLLAPILTLSAPSFSQKTVQRPVFLFGHFGSFISGRDNFGKVYDSNIGFAFGGGIGLSLSSQIYLYGKATHFSKTGVPIISTYNYEGGRLVSITETREGTAKFKEWIFNGGLQYNLFPSEEFTVGVMGGITYSKIFEEQRASISSVSSSFEGAGIIGMFVGVGLERNFPTSPLTGFIEAQYNYSFLRFFGLGEYGGLNLSLGIRYHFGERRIQ